MESFVKPLQPKICPLIVTIGNNFDNGSLILSGIKQTAQKDLYKAYLQISLKVSILRNIK